MVEEERDRPDWWHRASPPDEPSRTIGSRGNASLTDGATMRRLTVAEAAALQGFPAGWPFAGCLDDQYRQVGNAVPPALAEAIARAVLRVHGATDG